MSPTPDDLAAAAKALSRSEKGRQALSDLLKFFDHGAISLDGDNRGHVITLICGTWGGYAGTARDIMRDELEGGL